MEDKHWYSKQQKEHLNKRLKEIQRRKAFLQELEENLLKDYRVVTKELRKPRYVKILKIFVIILSISIFGFLIYNNFLASHEFIYFYDIGSEKDNYLSPETRITGLVIQDDVNYRNLTGHLVYYDVPIARGSSNVSIEVKFKDNFPENNVMSLGARDQEEWHYKYYKIYDSNNGEKKDEWIINSTQFNIIEDNLTIQDNKLSIVFNTPHLGENKNKTNHMHIPVDWISIKVNKKGLLEKYNIIK